MTDKPEKDDAETKAEERRKRIEKSREDLAERQRQHPELVAAYQARQARITAAKKRDQQRLDHLVFGHKREVTKPTKAKRYGRRKVVTKPAPVPLEPGLDEAAALREKWSHKQGTPETLEAASNTHSGALAQLHANGTIDADQLEWAAEIANVYRSIEAGVAVKVASLEARVDHAGSGRDRVREGVRRVRLHIAYGFWRDALPAPKALVLDMIVGDAVGYSVAAERHHVHKRKAKRLLIWALDHWPTCVQRACREVSQADIDAIENAA
jgi:hypothetical protein